MKVRGGFRTRWHVQWLRWCWRMLRLYLKGDTVRMLSEMVNEDMDRDDRQRVCPHRSTWHREYVQGRIRCEACGIWLS